MNAAIIDRIEFLRYERADIKEALKRRQEADVRAWLTKRLVRNTKTEYALLAVLETEKAEL